MLTFNTLQNKSKHAYCLCVAFLTANRLHYCDHFIQCKSSSTDIFFFILKSAEPTVKVYIGSKQMVLHY